MGDEVVALRRRVWEALAGPLAAALELAAATGRRIASPDGAEVLATGDVPGPRARR